MEDWNTLAADCIVISCCCQCLIIEIFVFVLLKLPYRMIRKTKRYAKKKLGQRRRGKTVKRGQTDPYKREYFFEIKEKGLERDEGHGCGCCMEEVEKVMEEFYQKGEFAFGSFWGREEAGSLPVNVSNHEFDSDVVQCCRILTGPEIPKLYAVGEPCKGPSSH